jgi:hypothetical protein
MDILQFLSSSHKEFYMYMYCTYVNKKVAKKLRVFSVFHGNKRNNAVRLDKTTEQRMFSNIISEHMPYANLKT